MKFLANENFPVPSIRILRQSGFETLSILEMNPGISDLEVVEIARKDNLIILTFDKDYGEILFKYKPDNPPDVIFFRFKGEMPEHAGLTLVELIQQGKITLKGHFTVIERENIRQRIL